MQEEKLPFTNDESNHMRVIKHRQSCQFKTALSTIFLSNSNSKKNKIIKAKFLSTNHALTIIQKSSGTNMKNLAETEVYSSTPIKKPDHMRSICVMKKKNKNF